VDILASKDRAQPVQRIPGEGSRIVPSLAEDGLHVADCGAADLDLDVMPGWPSSVDGRDRFGLPVSRVCVVVVTAVTQVDTIDEGHILIGASRVAQHHELLMMRASRSYSHVEQALPAGSRYVLAQLSVLPLAELQSIQVRSPDQALDQHSAPCRRGQDVGDRPTGDGQAFIGVAAPVGEQQQVTGPQGVHRLYEFGEIARSVYQWVHVVAWRPGCLVGVATIQQRRRVAALLRGEQPLFQIPRHRGLLL
jgi:hypothetical protein